MHGEIYRKQAADKFPDSCKCTLTAIQAVQNKNSTNKGREVKESLSWSSSYLSRKCSWVPIEKCETDISVKTVSSSSSITRVQFLLTLDWINTVHRVQGSSLEQGAIDFDVRQKK